MSDTQPPRTLGADFTTGVFARIDVDRYTAATCRLGPVWLGWTARGVSALRLADSPDAEGAFVRWYRLRTGRRIVRAIEIDAIARAAQLKLGDPSAADVPLDLEAATPLERDVLAKVAEIRQGYARPGVLIAGELGLPAGSLSVAEILTQNAVPLFVPCHRVVGEDRCCGSDYVFGAQAQAQLLECEGLDARAVDRVIQQGFRYIENDGWFCLPTCGDIARNLGAPGYIGLHSLSEAHGRGLRGCESCRPCACRLCRHVAA